MRLTVFGAGYVGLVTSVCFAELRHTVVAVDKDPEVVARLADGVPTLYEPGLEDLLRANLREGRLTFTTSATDALQRAEIVFLCVGTPGRADGRADLSQMDEVVRSIAPMLNDYTLIVEKSTVPVDTAGCIIRTLRRLTGTRDGYEVASNPEFLREGSAIEDFLHPDRIVIGADSMRARALLLDLYRRDFVCPILLTDIKNAELIKHAANAFLATKISFINMVADLCERVGADISMVAQGIGLDHRIGPHFLQAGLGFGGSCFPKDLKALVRIAEDLGVDFGLLREVERINEARATRLIRTLNEALWVLRHKTVGVLGAAFKANTDDIRNAPSLHVIPQLREQGALLRIYDPQAAAKLAARFPEEAGLQYAQSAYEAATGAHALLILTDWGEFRSLDWEQLRCMMRTPVVVDGRNLFDPITMREFGFEYYSFGRANTPDSLSAEMPGRREPPRDSQPSRVHMGSLRHRLSVGGSRIEPAQPLDQVAFQSANRSNPMG
jgi:UDPglucose 6-dehydrogenase